MHKYITINKGPFLYRGKEFNVIEPPKHYDGIALVRGWSLDNLNIPYNLLYHMVYNVFVPQHAFPPWTSAIMGRGFKSLEIRQIHRRCSLSRTYAII